MSFAWTRLLPGSQRYVVDVLIDDIDCQRIELAKPRHPARSPGFDAADKAVYESRILALEAAIELLENER